jgi:spoIIIJ-associated protein
MTKRQEFNAGTVDEAVEKAATNLGIPVAEVSYEVVDGGSEGFLGIGARDARIVVQVPGAGGPLETPASEVPGTEEHEEETLLLESEATEEEVADTPFPPDLSEVFRESAEEGESVTAPEELLNEVRDLVAAVVGAMGFEARVDVYDANGFIAVDVASDSTALFIGQKGETIDAIQYLVNAAVYRQRPFVKRIVLDAEGYRQRRVEAIQGIAHRTARRAVRERRPVELPPMSPAERRVVHIFLKDNPKVTTASEGSGENRRVKISPA